MRFKMMIVVLLACSTYSTFAEAIAGFGDLVYD